MKTLEINGTAYIRSKDSNSFAAETDELNAEPSTIDLSAVTIDASAFDKDTTGTYEIQYHMTDPDGDVGVARLYVVVREDDVKVPGERPETE